MTMTFENFDTKNLLMLTYKYKLVATGSLLAISYPASYAA